MKLSYETQGSHTYLICQLDVQEPLDTAVLGMLNNNQITGFAPVTFSQFNENRTLKYDVTAKVTVKQVFAGAVSKKRLLDVFAGILSAVLAAEDYMIDISNLLVHPDYIFVDISNNNTELICLPTQSHISSSDLGIFFKEVLFQTQFDQSENNDYVGKLLSSFNSMPVFSASAFQEIIRQLDQEAVVVSKELKVTPSSAGGRSDLISVVPPVSPPQNFVPVAPVPSPIAKPVPMASPPTVPVQNNTVETAEKPISLFYLLQHYNAENKAKYDAQKRAKKAGSKEAGSVGNKQKSPKKQGKAKPVKPVPQGFAIPGQETPVSSPKAAAPSVAAVFNPAAPVTPAPSPSPSNPSAQEYRPPVNASPARPYSAENVSLDFGDTVYDFAQETGADAGTVILGMEAADQKLVPQLVRKKNGERIFVDKPLFRLGRDRGFVDYAITDNKYIGHSHCHIVSRDGEYFVVDDNSRNHTYVDGTMIIGSTDVKIAHGQVITLANEDFEFRLY